jgi:hypothetical protein
MSHCRTSIMRTIVNLFLFLSLISSILPASADTDEDSRAWAMVVGEGQIVPGKLRWYLEGQARFKEDWQQFDQGFIRPALNWQVSERSSVWLGYLYADTKTANGHSYEDRIWQQYQYVSNKDAGNTWLFRSRLEQRFHDVDDKTSHRFRQMVRRSIPANQSGSLSYLLWDEVFFNLNDTNWTGDNGFAQNRLFAGFLYKTTASSRLELGYMNQYVNGTNGADNQSNHILSTSLFMQF